MPRAKIVTLELTPATKVSRSSDVVGFTVIGQYISNGRHLIVFKKPEDAVDPLAAKPKPVAKRKPKPNARPGNAVAGAVVGVGDEIING